MNTCTHKHDHPATEHAVADCCGGDKSAAGATTAESNVREAQADKVEASQHESESDEHGSCCCAGAKKRSRAAAANPPTPESK